MHFKTSLLFLLLTPLLATAHAADPNGYSAQYECRAGGPRCNVDVAAQVSQPCDQVITSSDSDWSKITRNTSAAVFCIQAGDHSSKGVLTINFSGAPSKYKILRYYRPNDTDDEPWFQSSANQAKVRGITFVGARYWIVHRLVVDPNFASGSSAIHLSDNVTISDHIIINRVLAQHGERQVYVQGATDSVIQNSVFRNSIKSTTLDADGVSFGFNPQNVWVVNNEIYQIHSHGFYIGADSTSPGTVVENNDIYADSSQWTNCNGTYTPNDPNSPCSDAEAAISLKAGGTSANPVRVMHNRVWGLRRTDTNLCCIDGSQGQIISLSNSGVNATTHAVYVLLQNNIITEGQHGIQSPREGPQHNSIIGNILYRIKDYYAPIGSIGSWAFSALGHWDNNEVYLNTIIASDSWADFGSGNGNLDVECNVIISSGRNAGTTVDAGTTIDHNAFIGTTEFTTDGGVTDITRSVSTRSNSTSYSLGSLVQFAPVNACSTGTEAACFLYKVVGTGTSALSVPTACTTLGCKFTDGGVTWEAVRGPFLYKRKLRTIRGGEVAVIPYAVANNDAPESAACNAPIGTRVGIGIADLPVL